MLIELGERALALEDTDSLSHAGAGLLSLPLKDKSGAGLYYAALALMRQGDRAQAAQLLEGVAGSGSLHFSKRALLALGVHRHGNGDYRGASDLYQDALKGQNPDALTILGVQSNLAVMESESGEHRAAFKRLESLMPLARIIGHRQPAHYLNYLNSLAVESLAVGQPRAAQGYLEPCLRSPLLSRFPQWQETAQEFATRSRVFIESLPPLPDNIASIRPRILAMFKEFPPRPPRPRTHAEEAQSVFTNIFWLSDGQQQKMVEMLRKAAERNLSVESLDKTLKYMDRLADEEAKLEGRHGLRSVEETDEQ